MRPGHKWSRGSQEGLEADAEVGPLLKAVQQGELIDEDGAEHPPLGRDEPPRGHLAVGIKEGFELLVEVLNGVGAALVEEAPHLDPVILMRLGAALGRGQAPPASGAVVPQRGVIIAGVAQQKAHRGRQRRQEAGG